MSEVQRVDDRDSLRQAILQHDSVLVVGNRTKPSLSKVNDATAVISASGLSGIVEYEPSEFTFTALAGTAVSDIIATLAEKQQYLPFDPIDPETATIGGVLASGLSGPGRHRFGGLRDFILGIEFLTGDGNVVRAGSKVVKNAAGFDIPKLMVGSCGRLGALTELTFKVFPRPTQWHTYQIQCQSDADACQVLAAVAGKRWEADAIDYFPSTSCVWIRLGGDSATADALSADIRATFADRNFSKIDADQASETWNRTTHLRLSEKQDEAIVKVPCTLAQFKQLSVDLPHAYSLRFGAAGSILWVGCPSSQLPDLHGKLHSARLDGLIVRGELDGVDGCWIGHREQLEMARKIKQAIDPESRFPDWLLTQVPAKS